MERQPIKTVDLSSSIVERLASLRLEPEESQMEHNLCKLERGVGSCRMVTTVRVIGRKAKSLRVRVGS
jgi:hypothetical protein